jgi:hypothetical protein
LSDRSPRPDRVWNRIPDGVRERIVKLARDEPTLSPRELALRFTDRENYFVSEASVYRLLKAHDLISSPAFIVMKAADEFKDKTTAPNQLFASGYANALNCDFLVNTDAAGKYLNKAFDGRSFSATEVAKISDILILLIVYCRRSICISFVEGS